MLYAIALAATLLSVTANAMTVDVMAGSGECAYSMLRRHNDNAAALLGNGGANVTTGATGAAGAGAGTTGSTGSTGAPAAQLTSPECDWSTEISCSDVGSNTMSCYKIADGCPCSQTEHKCQPPPMPAGSPPMQPPSPWCQPQEHPCPLHCSYLDEIMCHDHEKHEDYCAPLAQGCPCGQGYKSCPPPPMPPMPPGTPPVRPMGPFCHPEQDPCPVFCSQTEIPCWDEAAAEDKCFPAADGCVSRLCCCCCCCCCCCYCCCCCCCCYCYLCASGSFAGRQTIHCDDNDGQCFVLTSLPYSCSLIMRLRLLPLHKLYRFLA